MKRKALAISNIIMGIVYLVYFIFQNTGISATAFGDYPKTKEAVQFFAAAFMYVSALLAVILLIFAVKSFLNRKKDGDNFVGDTIVMGTQIIALIGLLIMGNPTILAPMCALGGVIMLRK